MHARESPQYPCDTQPPPPPTNGPQYASIVTDAKRSESDQAGGRGTTSSNSHNRISTRPLSVTMDDYVCQKGVGGGPRQRIARESSNKAADGILSGSRHRARPACVDAYLFSCACCFDDMTISSAHPPSSPSFTVTIVVTSSGHDLWTGASEGDEKRPSDSVIRKCECVADLGVSSLLESILLTIERAARTGCRRG